jgi:hypothetical protein
MLSSLNVEVDVVYQGSQSVILKFLTLNYYIRHLFCVNSLYFSEFWFFLFIRHYLVAIEFRFARRLLYCHQIKILFGNWSPLEDHRAAILIIYRLEYLRQTTLLVVFMIRLPINFLDYRIVSLHRLKRLKCIFTNAIVSPL